MKTKTFDLKKIEKLIDEVSTEGAKHSTQFLKELLEDQLNAQKNELLNSPDKLRTWNEGYIAEISIYEPILEKCIEEEEYEIAEKVKNYKKDIIKEYIDSLHILGYEQKHIDEITNSIK